MDSNEGWKSASIILFTKNYICHVLTRLTVVLFGVFLLIGASASAQDLIVRIYGDTLNAKIDKEDTRFIYYRTAETRRGEMEIIARKEVKEILYDFIQVKENRFVRRKPKKKHEIFQVIAHAGYSYILNTDDLYGEDFESVYREMRDGPFLDVRANYFLSADLGLGLLVSRSEYGMDEDIPILVELSDGTELTGDLSHSRELNYYAFNLAFTVQSSHNFKLQIDVGAGALYFRDNSTFINDYTLESTALGGHISAGFHLVLGEGFYLPAVVSIKGFSLSNFDLATPSEMNEEVARGLQSIYDNLNNGISAGRIQLGLGLGFAF
jgi:hypothetical protein